MNQQQRGLALMNLAGYLKAGITPETALASLGESGTAGERRATLECLRKLASGVPLHKSIAQAFGCETLYEAALLEAGEISGRMPDNLQLIGGHLEDTYQERRRLLSSLIYPTILVHMAVLVIPLSKLVQGKETEYINGAVAMLLPLYLTAGSFCWIPRFPGAPCRIESWTRKIPYLNSLIDERAMTRMAGITEGCLAAGMSFESIWLLAGRASGSCLRQDQTTAWAQSIRQGIPPSRLMAFAGFPAVFTSQYTTGEKTGTLQETCARLRRLYAEAAKNRSQKLIMVLSKTILVLAIGISGWKIVQSYLDCFRAINEAMGTQ